MGKEFKETILEVFAVISLVGGFTLIFTVLIVNIVSNAERQALINEKLEKCLELQEDKNEQKR